MIKNSKPTNSSTALCLIRRAEVQKRTGLGASSIYQLQRDGVFPLPVRLSECRVAWVESEVMAWVKARIAERAEVQQ